MQLERLDYQAVGDVLLVEQLRPMKQGVIHLVQHDLRKYNIGRVASVGPDVKRAREGNIIAWEVFKGQAADQRDDERWFIRDADVLGVLKAVPAWITAAVEEIDKRNAEAAAAAKNAAADAKTFEAKAAK
jgi:co-chaperonin GroES (HSP10)